jgi:hypothetical protein
MAPSYCPLSILKMVPASWMYLKFYTKGFIITYQHKVHDIGKLYNCDILLKKRVVLKFSSPQAGSLASGRTASNICPEHISYRHGGILMKRHRNDNHYEKLCRVY